MEVGAKDKKTASRLIMENQKPRRTFFRNITARKIRIITAIYAVGMLLIAMAMTDMFTEFTFNKRYSVLLVILAFDTVIVVRMWQVYLKNKKENRE